MSKKIFRFLLFLIIIFQVQVANVFAGENWEWAIETGRIYTGMFYDGLSTVRYDAPYDGLFPDSSTSAFGYINKDAKIVIPLTFDRAIDFSEGLAAVAKDDKWGYIDKTGKVVIPFEYTLNWGSMFSEGLVAVSKNDKWGYIDKTGKIVIPLEYDDASMFHEGLAQVSKNGKDGYIDKTGKVIIPFEYDSTIKFSEGLAAVSKNGKYGYIDKTGKVIIPLEYGYAFDFSEGLAAVTNFSENDVKSGYIDKTGKLVIPFKFGNNFFVQSFSEGLAVVEKDDKSEKYGYIDKEGKLVIPFEYEYGTYDFSEGLGLVKKNDKYGYIDKTGKVVIPIEFTKAEPFLDGLAKVLKDGKRGYIRYTGGEKNKESKPESKLIIGPFPSSMEIIVNGEKTIFYTYDTNLSSYFKLRSIAIALNQTEKQFDISYDEDKKAIKLISGKPYTIQGGESEEHDGTEKFPILNNSKIYKDDSEVSLEMYNIDGDTYVNMLELSI